MDNNTIDIDVLRQYANEFWDDLKKVLWVANPSMELVPVVFAYPSEKVQKRHIYGTTNVHLNEQTLISSVFPVVYLYQDRPIKEYQETVRHELIHYYLWLKHKNHEDNSVMFWLLSDLFDGGAYEQMNPQKTSLYMSSKKYVDELYSLYQANPCNSCAIKLSMMLDTIDSAEEAIAQKGPCDCESTLALLLRAAKYGL